MKRLFTSILAAFMCSLFVGGLSCLAYSDIQQKDLENIVERLSGYGIISGYPDDTFRPDKPLTRVEIAKLIMVTTNQDIPSTDNTAFTDIPPDHWAVGYVAAARNLGIINGVTSTTFQPDTNVTYEQVIKMLVAALGYDAEARSAGGYPTGYIAVANQLNVLDGIEADYGDVATRGDVARMIFIALEAPYYTLHKSGDSIVRTTASGVLRDVFTGIGRLPEPETSPAGPSADLPASGSAPQPIATFVDQTTFTTDESVLLRWNAVANATTYDIAVLQLSGSGAKEWLRFDDIPGTSLDIGKLPAGEYQIRALAKNAWGTSPPSDSTLFVAESVKRVGYVYNTDREGLRMRQGPDLKAAVITVMPEQAQLTVLGEQKVDQFYNIEWNGIRGWASSEFISLNASPQRLPFTTYMDKTAFATDEKVVLRWTSPADADVYQITLYQSDQDGEQVALEYANPVGQSLNIGKIPAGEYSFRLTATNAAGESLVSNTTAFVVKNANRTGYVNNTENQGLRLRQEPNLQAATIGVIPEKAQVTIVGAQKVDQFYKVEWNGKSGWASSDFITIDASSAASSFPPAGSPLSLDVRTTAPEADNDYYYSNKNLFYAVKLSPPFYNGGQRIYGNCTWYAWGRAYEILGENPGDFFNGNAYTWWASNIKSGKYKYGSEAKPGAIAVWQGQYTGGDGHVAIVETIENGKIYVSESSWPNVNFRYTEIQHPEYLLGYIYITEPNW